MDVPEHSLEPPCPPEPAVSDPGYWFCLIDEKAAARFLGFSVRHVQGLRYRGDGPAFVRVSARCVRYRRWELWRWAGDRLRTSTSEP